MYHKGRPLDHIFILCVNDIFNVVLNVKCILYADDTTLLLHDFSILALINNASTCFQLFSTLFIDKKQGLNSKKTNFMVFSRYKNSFAPATVTFDSHVVYTVDNFRHLGYVIDGKLSWQNHIPNVNSKVSKNIGMIKRRSSFLPRSCLLYIYYSIIFPYLLSGIKFWGCITKTAVANTVALQKKTFRLICGVDLRTHCAPLARLLNILLLDDL